MITDLNADGCRFSIALFGQISSLPTLRGKVKYRSLLSLLVWLIIIILIIISYHLHYYSLRNISIFIFIINQMIIIVTSHLAWNIFLAFILIIILVIIFIIFWLLSTYKWSLSQYLISLQIQCTIIIIISLNFWHYYQNHYYNHNYYWIVNHHYRW